LGASCCYLALQRLGIEIIGVLGSSEDKSHQVAERLGLTKAYRHLAQVLDDEQVQSVHITTPNRLHFQMASEALQAGKHVMCEKPLAMNSDESAKLVELARKTGKAAGVCYNIRFYPLCLESRDMVQRGELGEIYFICGSYSQDWLFYQTDYNWRVLTQQQGESRAKNMVCELELRTVRCCLLVMNGPAERIWPIVQLSGDVCLRRFPVRISDSIMTLHT
jgi:predicted dehydrogenase